MRQLVLLPIFSFPVKQKFVLRSHLYQARSLIGSDASGLSGEIFRLSNILEITFLLYCSYFLQVSYPLYFPYSFFHPQCCTLFVLFFFSLLSILRVITTISCIIDAFAKVIFTHFIAETRVIWETRSPTWDQMIIFEDILLWGDVNEIAVNPPTIVVEIFDKDIGV